MDRNIGKLKPHPSDPIGHRRVVMFNPIRLVLITLISLFIFSCDEDDNVVLEWY